MKSRKIKCSLTVLFIIIVGLIGYFRYQQINAHPVERGVIQERFFKQNELVHAHAVEFVVHHTKLTQTKNDVSAQINLSLKQTGTANYGQKHHDPDFRDNMYLNVPYGISNQCDYLLNQNGKRVGYNYLKKHLQEKQKYTLYFSVPRETYDQRSAKTRFSFLIPVQDHYVKYSLLLE
ncbi:hypothetical protein OZX69_06605 [Lactobacillus sp. ESL0731]|uniref:hypothetical protein n=1 Tax=unclassified Lactobacillus TaxID=2620435 RepID=UPI0023F7C35F|nr:MULTISPECIES: hypothetical protein [unclassified Lactobacillus]WEV50617.1 hypothetical protein OZX63_06600 [Lactobacillus sp. ESL0700]WEV61747.1 hypothetical protein OZX69_06605 [Lactobacillus sp. ESL0731]